MNSVKDTLYELYEYEQIYPACADDVRIRVERELWIAILRSDTPRDYILVTLYE